jgi:hypothetical protein
MYLLDMYLHMFLKHGLYLKLMSGGYVCLKERCFDVFSERNKRTKYGEKRYNYELYEIFNDSNIVNYTKAKRVAWAGHLMCMNYNRI